MTATQRRCASKTASKFWTFDPCKILRTETLNKVFSYHRVAEYATQTIESYCQNTLQIVIIHLKHILLSTIPSTVKNVSPTKIQFIKRYFIYILFFEKLHDCSNRMISDCQSYCQDTIFTSPSPVSVSDNIKLSGMSTR